MLRKILVAAMVGPFLLAGVCLAAPPLSPEQRALDADQRQLVAQTCDRVMRLASGGLYRQQCMDSLARSLAIRAAGMQLAASHELCSSQGLEEGTAAFSTCMLDNREGGAPSIQPVTLASAASSPEDARSYFDVSNSVHWQREQYACAQIGLTPGTAAFGRCVASLNGALFNPF